MNLKEFQQQRKDTLTAEYAELKKTLKQAECFTELAAKHNLSESTVRQIIFNTNYCTKKPTKAA